MKNKRINHLLRMVLILDFLCALLFFVFLVYAFWSMNAPSHVNVPFPNGTQILQKTDTHQGFFRRHGTAITVAQIPTESVQRFGNRLIEEDFWEGYPYDEPRQRLETIAEAKIALESDNILWTYRDEAIALIEEPYSDYFAAIYDLETGLLCCIEHDG